MKNHTFILLVCLTVLGSFFYSVEVHAVDAGVCGDCHQDIAKEWETSIHAANGISCYNCHGGDPKDAENAMSPKAGFVGKPSSPAEVPAFCGKCHVGVEENYLKSPHSEAVTSGGPTCVTCHTAHQQKRANLSLISETLCGKCHSYERAEKIRNAMLMSETEITNLEERIDALHAQEYDMDSIKKSLFATRNKFHRLTHILNVNMILKETTGIQSEIGRLKDEISEDEKSETKRKIYGSAFIFFLFLGALIFWWYRNTVLSDKD